MIKRLPKNIVLMIVALFCVFPLFWMVIAATNKSVDVLRGTLLPGTYLAENWKTLVSTYEIGPALWNSVKYSVVTTAVSLVVSSIAGYGFEVYHDKIKDSFIWSTYAYHDDTIYSNDDPTVQYVFQNAFAGHNNRFHPAVNISSISDNAV